MEETSDNQGSPAEGPSMNELETVEEEMEDYNNITIKEEEQSDPSDDSSDEYTEGAETDEEEAYPNQVVQPSGRTRGPQRVRVVPRNSRYGTEPLGLHNSLPLWSPTVWKIGDGRTNASQLLEALVPTTDLPDVDENSEIDLMLYELEEKTQELKDLKASLANTESLLHSALRGELKPRGEEYVSIKISDLTCSICTDILIEPAVVNCGHMFCRLCILQWRSTSEEGPVCAICREGILTLARAYHLGPSICEAVAKLPPNEQQAWHDEVKEREQKIKDLNLESQFPYGNESQPRTDSSNSGSDQGQSQERGPGAPHQRLDRDSEVRGVAQINIGLGQIHNRQIDVEMHTNVTFMPAQNSGAPPPPPDSRQWWYERPDEPQEQRSNVMPEQNSDIGLEVEVETEVRQPNPNEPPRTEWQGIQRPQPEGHNFVPPPEPRVNPNPRYIRPPPLTPRPPITLLEDESFRRPITAFHPGVLFSMEPRESVRLFAEMMMGPMKSPPYGEQANQYYSNSSSNNTSDFNSSDYHHSHTSSYDGRYQFPTPNPPTLRPQPSRVPNPPASTPRNETPPRPSPATAESAQHGENMNRTRPSWEFINRLSTERQRFAESFGHTRGSWTHSHPEPCRDRSRSPVSTYVRHEIHHPCYHPPTCFNCAPFHVGMTHGEEH